jgi:uncharacterized damage-inducible protein DinB
MSTKPTKIGRPRRYDLSVPQGFASRELALSAAYLQELAERVYDQILDLPTEALDFTPGDSNLSIGWLVVHLAWAEGRWIGLATGAGLDPAVRARLEPGGLEHYGTAQESAGDPATLIELCRKVQREHTLPALQPIADIDEPMERGGLSVTCRGVMQQLAWHWTYHSGQIGLIRLLWGSDYQWTMESMRASRPQG